jgi:membrane protein YqaA with SNARE-associated domain
MKSLARKLSPLLLAYGGWGLFAMSFFDSSFIPFPVVNDLALMMMANRRPLLWPLYGLASTLGSAAGAYVLYGIARGGGESLWRKAKPSALARTQRWLERNDFVAVLVAALLPPPAPLKLFLLTAGVMRVNAIRFGLAMLVGRGLRFCAEAWLGAHYGPQAQVYLAHNLVRVSLVTLALVISLSLLNRWWNRRARFGFRHNGGAS